MFTANQKIWNLEIIAVATFDDLPSDIKNAAINQYRSDEAKSESNIAHDGKAYVMTNMIVHKAEGMKGLDRLQSSRR